MAAPNPRLVAAGVAAAALLATPVVAKWEGLRNDPYDDVRGIRTVCFGETLAVEERHHSNEECIAKLERSLKRHAAEAQACLPETLPPPMLAAFASFTYNVGAPNACRSTAFKRAWAGDYRGACDALLWWTKADGKEVRGLYNRRNDERRLCLEGLS